MVIKMLKSVLPVQGSRQLPLTISTKNDAVTLSDYAWIECRSEGSGLAGRNIYRALTARRRLFICLDEGDQRLRPLDLAEEILAQLAGMFRNVTAASINQVTIVYPTAMGPEVLAPCGCPTDSHCPSPDPGPSRRTVWHDGSTPDCNSLWWSTFRNCPAAGDQ